MRVFKLAFISIIILFIVVTLLGLLLPASVTVSRAIDINAPKDSLYNLVKDFKGWKKWVYGMNDSSVQIQSDSFVKMRGAEIEIKNIKDSVVNFIWTSKNGNQQIGRIQVIAQSNKAVVQWQFIQVSAWYPWQRFSSMINDKDIGSMLEINLNNLKKLAEQ